MPRIAFVSRIRAIPTITAVTAALVACSIAAAASAATAQQPERQGGPPLGVFAERTVVVVPVQYLRRGDPMGWAEEMGRSRPFMVKLDEEIAGTLQDRRVTQWIYPEDVVRSAKRNPTYMPDPYTLGAQRLRPPIKKLPEMLPEPLASQVRTIAAVDNGRYILVPIELRFEPVSESDASHAGSHDARDDAATTGSTSESADSTGSVGTAPATHRRGRAVLNVAIIDARLSRIIWLADIASDPQDGFSPALATNLAGHVADLFAAP
ncbi:MAG TPA: hypothetical protein VFK13_02130 [Gemmatimonadaceae bacterium]|nr:hypothetical protein [Gemmatimonadaceae bacterium]